MNGGNGNDTYVINAAGDTITDEGIADTDDQVKSSVTVNLAILAAGPIEHAILTGASAINATGNDRITSSPATTAPTCSTAAWRGPADRRQGGDTYGSTTLATW